MKGRWEKVWNMGNILWNYSTWPMGEWGKSGKTRRAA